MALTSAYARNQAPYYQTLAGSPRASVLGRLVGRPKTTGPSYDPLAVWEIRNFLSLGLQDAVAEKALELDGNRELRLLMRACMLRLEQDYSLAYLYQTIEAEFTPGLEYLLPRAPALALTSVVGRDADGDTALTLSDFTLTTSPNARIHAATRPDYDSVVFTYTAGHRQTGAASGSGAASSTLVLASPAAGPYFEGALISHASWSAYAEAVDGQTITLDAAQAWSGGDVIYVHALESALRLGLLTFISDAYYLRGSGAIGKIFTGDLPAGVANIMRDYARGGRSLSE